MPQIQQMGSTARGGSGWIRHCTFPKNLTAAYNNHHCQTPRESCNFTWFLSSRSKGHSVPSLKLPPAALALPWGVFDVPPAIPTIPWCPFHSTPTIHARPLLCKALGTQESNAKILQLQDKVPAGSIPSPAELGPSRPGHCTIRLRLSKA